MGFDFNDTNKWKDMCWFYFYISTNSHSKLYLKGMSNSGVTKKRVLKGQSEVPGQREKGESAVHAGASTVVTETNSFLGMETSSQYVSQSCINVSHVGWLR